MSDWSKPTITDLYTDVIGFLDARLDDIGSFFVTPPSNVPAGTMRFVRATAKFQEWDGAVWQDKSIGVAGGGTGGTDPASARTALGLGTISVQNANGIAVTGGTLAGITGLSMSGDMAFATDGAFKIGTATNRPSILYLRNGIVLPVGTDKWVTG